MVMENEKVIQAIAKCKALEPQDQVKEILDEAERNFDRAIIDFNTGVEKLFDVLNMLAEKNAAKTENE